MKNIPPRRVRRQAARDAGIPFEPLVGSRQPFKRAIAIHKSIGEALKQPTKELRALALCALSVYRSRGHGRGRGVR